MIALGIILASIIWAISGLLLNHYWCNEALKLNEYWYKYCSALIDKYENGPIEEKLCTDCKWYNYTCECPVHCTQDTKIAWEKAEGDAK